MTKTRSLILVGSLMLLAALTLLAAMPAAVDHSADREEIEALMWRYARALDGFNPDAYAAVYTRDGQFGTGTGATKGQQALKDMIKGLKDSRDQRAAAGETVPPMYHMTTDSWIEFTDATHARHHSYWLTVFGAAGRGGTPNVAAAGRGVDDLVKVDGKWLIQTRNVAPQD
ncbi:MAG TPA: nuclear transport factor 2 family protein [Terriglobia bacterium]|nr:nuclear transport factor 2 family protein [Terriglobia bacterium]